jgi:hypothetical protein
VNAHPLSTLVLSRAVERDGAVTLDDNALAEIVSAYGKSLASEPAEATQALIAVAMFLDVEKRSPALSRTLLTLAFAAEPVLRELGDAKSMAAAAQIHDSKARFGTFTGDDRVQRVLDTGARPAGTVAASPLARFQVQAPRR